MLLLNLITNSFQLQISLFAILLYLRSISLHLQFCPSHALATYCFTLNWSYHTYHLYYSHTMDTLIALNLCTCSWSFNQLHLVLQLCTCSPTLAEQPYSDGRLIGRLLIQFSFSSSLPSSFCTREDHNFHYEVTVLRTHLDNSGKAIFCLACFF